MFPKLRAALARNGRFLQRNEPQSFATVQMAKTRIAYVRRRMKAAAWMCRQPKVEMLKFRQTTQVPQTIVGDLSSTQRQPFQLPEIA
jgi:hypothetical protein